MRLKRLLGKGGVALFLLCIFVAPLPSLPFPSASSLHNPLTRPSPVALQVIVTVTDIDFDRGLVGNSIRATSMLITHNYSFAHDNSVTGAGKPWVAYWTGGNRLSQLRNNADGRFRLEIDVRFMTQGGVVVDNRSPIVMQIPVMPVVYPPSGTATFQVAAYDPDYGDRKDQVRLHGAPNPPPALLLPPLPEPQAPCLAPSASPEPLLQPILTPCLPPSAPSFSRSGTSLATRRSTATSSPTTCVTGRSPTGRSSRRQPTGRTSTT